MQQIDRKSRLSRAIILGGISTVLGAASHTIAGAALPNVGAFAAAVLFSVTFVLPLIKSKPSIAATTVSVTVSQVLYHSLFSYFPANLALTGSYDPHAHHKPIVMNLDAIAYTAAPGMGMLVAHILAGIATLLLLHSSERAVANILTLWVVLQAALTEIIARWIQVPANIAGPSFQTFTNRFVAPDFAQLARIVLGVRPTRGPPVLN